MNRALILIIVMSFLITGCAGVDIYTFKKARVDQDIKGNEGYLEGEIPEEDAYRNPKRTLIGIDIDMTGMSSGKRAETDVTEEGERTITSDTAPGGVKTVTRDTTKGTVKEEWIK